MVPVAAIQINLICTSYHIKSANVKKKDDVIFIELSIVADYGSPKIRKMNEELETGKTEKNKYALAGWLAITGAILLFPEILFGLLVEIKPDKLGLLVFPYGITAITEVAFTVYAFLRFKDLLNEKYSFHQVDLLVLLIVIGSIVGTSFAVVVKHLHVFGILEPTPAVKIATMTSMMIIAIPLSVIGIFPIGIKPDSSYLSIS